MLIADTHVHLYDAFNLEALLNAALDHFDRTAVGQGRTPPLGILCLTDSEGRASDRMLVEEVGDMESWRFVAGEDGASVTAIREDGRELHLLPGRQMVSVENLEVLGLSCRMHGKDRTETAAALLDRVREAGGIPVLPWSFGKWTGRRGRVVRELIEKRGDFLVADNGNRWRRAPMPRLLQLAQKTGRRILAGSDPLPFNGEEARAGSCGVLFPGEWAAEAPAESFRKAVAGGIWQRYGEGSSFSGFATAMVRMQWRRFAS